MGQRVTTLEYTLFGEFECWNHDSIAHSQKLNKNEINRNEGEPKMEYKQWKMNLNALQMNSINTLRGQGRKEKPM